MKLRSSIAIIFIAITVILLSCKKQSSSEKSDEPVLINEKVISQIINLPEDEQKTAFRLLNTNEMSFLWSSKFIKVKESEKLNRDQIAFIDDLLSIIKPDLFLINSKTNIEFRTTLGKNISQKARILFGEENARKLLASISPYKSRTVTPNYVDPGDGGVKKCKCSSESNYCNPLAPCDEQPEDICKHTTLGCGTLLVYSCDGLCRQV